MRPQLGFSILGTAALLLAAAAPVGAQGPTIETLADGLSAPRGIAIGADGAVYVVQAGSAGDTCWDTPEGEGPGGQACYGPTGSVVRISGDTVETIIDGLPSSGAGTEVGGISDIAFIDDQSFYLIANLGGDPASRESLPAEMADMAGWLLRGSLDGAVEKVADVAAFEGVNDPDAGQPGSAVDSNPYSVAVTDAGALVADAGGNDLLQVDASGNVSLVAQFPPRTFAFPPEVFGGMAAVPEGEYEPVDSATPPPGQELVQVPVQAVPTSVVVGPDGAYYVGQLTGAPFPAGGASVWRVVPGEEPSEYATGFTNIIDLGFGPDGTLYVAEIAHDGLMGFFMGAAPATGALLSVPPGGGEPQVIVSGEGLMSPGGLAVADDGAVYVATGTLLPGEGAVVKITP